MLALEKTLVKFGKRKHMRKLYEKGEIKIREASWYSDPSLNPAVRDDETTIERRISSEGASISIKRPGTGEYQELKGLIGDMHRTLRTADYYVYCMALSQDHELFGDFGANSCVVISDPSAFAERISDAVKHQLPGWHFRSGCVKYIESYTTNPRDFMIPDIDLCFTKLDSYSHQLSYCQIWCMAWTDQAAALHGSVCLSCSIPSTNRTPSMTWAIF